MPNGTLAPSETVASLLARLTWVVITGEFLILLWKMHVAFVAVVPPATDAVAVLPLNVQFVPSPDANT